MYLWTLLYVFVLDSPYWIRFLTQVIYLLNQFAKMSKCSLRSRTSHSVEGAPSSKPLMELDTVAVKKPATSKKVVAPKKPTARQQPTERGRGEAGGVEGEEGEFPSETRPSSQNLDLRPRPQEKRRVCRCRWSDRCLNREVQQEFTLRIKVLWLRRPSMTCTMFIYFVLFRKQMSQTIYGCQNFVSVRFIISGMFYLHKISYKSY